MKKRLSVAISLAAPVLFALAIVLFPSDASRAAESGVSLCLNVVLPSLFPFFVASSLFVRAVGATGARNAGRAAFALGLVGGYPVGARTVVSLYESGALQKSEAERLLACCNNAGPAFMLGVVGPGVFGSVRAGALLLGIHAAAAGLLALIFTRGVKEKRAPAPAPADTRFIPALISCIASSFTAVLGVCGFVIFFSVVAGLLRRTGALAALSALLSLTGMDRAWAEKLLTGALELFVGVWTLKGQPTFPSFTAAAFMLGWGGLSVHFQTLSILSESGLRPGLYFLGKGLHALLSAALAAVVFLLLPGALPAFREVSGPVFSLRPVFLLPALMPALAACALLFIKSTGKHTHKRI